MRNDIPMREHLAEKVRARLQTDIGPLTRSWLERALEMIPSEQTVLFFELLEEELAKTPERLERELRNLHNARSG
jgi:hypothetical protein